MHLCWWNKSWRWENINKPFQFITPWRCHLSPALIYLFVYHIHVTCVCHKGHLSPLPVSWVWWSCTHSSQKVPGTMRRNMGSCTVNSKLLLNLIQPLKNSGWTWCWSETLVFKAWRMQPETWHPAVSCEGETCSGFKIHRENGKSSECWICSTWSGLSETPRNGMELNTHSLWNHKLVG